MGMLICGVCLFSFANPGSADELKVKQVVERYFEQQRRPWSETSGPYASVRLRMLSPKSGIVDAVLTTYGSMTLANSTRARLIVKKDERGWQVWARVH